MIGLRHFTDGDAAVIQQKLYPDLSSEEIRKMISDWRTNTFQGKYFEMLALTEGDAVVGCVSLYEHTKNVASIGTEVFPGERRRGYASEGMRLILDSAKEKGYRIIQDQVLADNAASISLHEKLGFETDGYIYTNAKNKKVLLYLRFL